MRDIAERTSNWAAKAGPSVEKFRQNRREEGSDFPIGDLIQRADATFSTDLRSPGPVQLRGMGLEKEDHTIEGLGNGEYRSSSATRP